MTTMTTYTIITFKTKCSNKVYIDLSFNKRVANLNTYFSVLKQQQKKSKKDNYNMDVNDIDLTINHRAKYKTYTTNSTKQEIKDMFIDNYDNDKYVLVKAIKTTKKSNDKQLIKKYLHTYFFYSKRKEDKITASLNCLTDKSKDIYKSSISVIFNKYKIDYNRCITTNMTKIMKNKDFLTYLKSDEYTYNIGNFISAIKYLNKINVLNNEPKIVLNDDYLKYHKVAIASKVVNVNEKHDIKHSIKQETYICRMCDVSVYFKNRSSHSKTKKHNDNIEKYNKCIKI